LRGKAYKKARKITEASHTGRIDFKDYERMITDIVEVMDRNDNNWEWKVAELNAYEVRIYWEYTVDYLEEGRKGHFRLLSIDEGMGAFNPTGEIIEAADEPEYIEWLLKVIENYAHTRY